jgi:hypothetical protein
MSIAPSYRRVLFVNQSFNPYPKKSTINYHLTKDLSLITPEECPIFIALPSGIKPTAL